MYSHEEDIDSAIEVFTQAIQWYQQHQASQTRGANVQESDLDFLASPIQLFMLMRSHNSYPVGDFEICELLFCEHLSVIFYMCYK